jgi:hypothetical protein
MRRPASVREKMQGGSQGACPLAEYEAAPHARFPRRSPAPGYPLSVPPRTLFGLAFCPIDSSAIVRHASIRTLIAAFAAVELPQRLRWVVLNAADDLFRAVKRDRAIDRAANAHYRYCRVTLAIWTGGVG